MTIHEILASFKTKRILVIGDVMIDAYMLGKVHRVSPEALHQKLGRIARPAAEIDRIFTQTKVREIVATLEGDAITEKAILEASFEGADSTGAVA